MEPRKWRREKTRAHRVHPVSLRSRLRPKKMETLQSQIATSTTEVKTYTSELSELRRTYQTLEISLQSALQEVRC